MRDPRIDPIEGDVVERDGVVREVSDVWENHIVTFFHTKRGREDEGTLADLTIHAWRDRTAGATIVKRGDDPHTVTQEDRDALYDAIWKVIADRTANWVDRDVEVYDVVCVMAGALLGVIEESENAE